MRERLRGHLTEPWGILVAAVAGGVAWAVGLPVGVAAGVGAAVLGVRTLGGVLTGSRRRPRGPSRLPVRRKSLEERWLRRAEQAATTFRSLSRSVPSGPVAERCATMGRRVDATLDTVSRVAGQTSAVSEAMRHVHIDRLLNDRARLELSIKSAKRAAMREEYERALESVGTQLDVARRLDEASRSLLARLESSAIGLEALVARLAEVLAMTSSGSAATSELARIDELADELEGLRSGLAETEDVSARALRAFEAQSSPQRGS